MSDTGRPGADPTEPGGRPSWSATGATPPGAPRTTPPPVTSWQSAPTSQIPPVPPTSPTPQASTPPVVPPSTSDEPPADEAKKRPAWLLPAIIGVVILVVVALILAIVNSNGSDEAPPPVASTVVAESPTPTVEPVARTATTAFATALPASVLQYALATSADDPEWIAAGALEAYTETYTDGAAGTATVNAGQWETAPEATAFAESLVAALPAAPAPEPSASAEPGAQTFPQTGEVTAGGEAVGTYTIADVGDGNGVAVWTNGTSVFQVTAPLADIVDFYSAYPL